ncbi:sulfatase-like hydrolase/transferase [Edaphobacter acidisoli]|nr:sulfatase-like hydrolase/transferase [Edaphobacter acidisoli]
MNRRNFIELMGTGIVAAGKPLPLEALAPRSSGRPNFIFMICDDLAFRTIGSLNNPEVHTPNIDKLAASGCAFTHCFHQGSWSPAVCTPSRTMLNSGLSAFHAEAGLDEVHLWGQTLGAAGYDTYICGKWHLDPTALQRSFKEMGPIGPGMFESTPMAGAAYNRPSPGNHWEPWDKTQKGHWLHTDLWRNEHPDRIEHADVLYNDYFVDHLLNKAAKRNAPFFMYLGFNSPHDPRQSFKEDLALYPQEDIQVPPNFLPEHLFDQGDSRIRDEVLAPFPRTKEAVQLHRREYYALITLVDQQVGRVMEALAQSGKADNTYIILTADHGLAVGEHGLMGKQNLYDCSIRMPLIISGPGITPGKRVDELVYQHSAYATTCELAGVLVPQTVEFPSLVPLLHGGGKPVHEAVFCYYRDFQRMVRTRKHKLILYPKIKRIQLFDIENDPWEIHDLSADSSHAETRREMTERLVKMQQELGDPLLQADSSS